MKLGRGNGGRICATFLLLAALWLTGCRTVSNASPQVSSANLPEQKPHILFRVVCIDDVQAQQRPTCDVQVNLWQLGNADGKIAVLPKRISPDKFPLSKSSADQGWHDVAVEPGTYCVEIRPTGGDGSLIFDETSRPVYYLKVSTNQPVVYAGTIVFQRRVERHGNSFLNRFKVTEFRMKDFWNETETAKQITEKELAGAGEVTPCLLVPYDVPAVGQQPGVARVRAGAVATPTIGGNKSYLHSVADSPFMMPGEVLLAISGNSGEAGIYVVGAGLALFVVGAPIALTTEAITTHAHQKKWAAYQAALQNEIAAFHLDERLREQLAARLGGGTNSAPQNMWLQIQPYRVVLRGNEHQKFALEIAVRVQLFDSTDSAPIWEHSYVNASNYSGMAFELCETPVKSSIALCRLEDFGGNSGAELIRRQLRTAVEDLTRDISSQICGSNQSASSLANQIALPSKSAAF